MQKADESLQRKKNNWETWSQSIYMLFDLAEVTPYVEGTLPCPDPMIDPFGARNWRYNDTFTKIMISNNIAPSECPHTRGCATAHKMWQNLQMIYQSTSYLIQTEKIREICTTRVYEGMDIPEHLVQLKDKWDKISFYHHPNQENGIASDKFFKHLLAGLLPRSWDNFTQAYLHGSLDEVELDPKRRTDSQRAISASLPLTRRGLPRIYPDFTGRWRGTDSQEFIIPQGKYVSCRRIIIFDCFGSVIV